MFVYTVTLSLILVQVGSVKCFKLSPGHQLLGTHSTSPTRQYPSTIDSGLNSHSNSILLKHKHHQNSCTDNRCGTNLQTSFTSSVINGHSSLKKSLNFYTDDNTNFISSFNTLRSESLVKEMNTSTTFVMNNSVTQPQRVYTSSNNVPNISSHNLYFNTTINSSLISKVQTSISPNMYSQISIFPTSTFPTSAVITSASSYSLGRLTDSKSLLPSVELSSMLNNTVTTPQPNYTNLMTTTPFKNTTIAPTKVLPLILTPTLLKNASLGLHTPSCETFGTCCQYGFQQIPDQVHFKESMKPGYVLTEVHDVGNVTLSITIVQPQQLTTTLQGRFGITHAHNQYNIILNQQIDLEDLYLKSNKNIDVRRIRIQINCLEKGKSPVSTSLNVTVEDVDDAMPEFAHHGSQQSCVVPVYNAETSEDYTGDLDISPRRIKAVDGDISRHHRVLYKVMHAEPENYQEYFYLDQVQGTVNKTRPMNASDPRKYIIFVQAVEDSANQNARVAILSIEVYAPLQPGEKPITVNPAVRYALQIISALVLVGFAAGFLVIVHHRYRRRRLKVGCEEHPDPDLFKARDKSVDTQIADIPVITSPSQIEVQPKQKQTTKKKVLIVKKPLDTRARPGWNAPVNKTKKTTYNPYIAVQRIKKT